jgi:hypothetical protein
MPSDTKDTKAPISLPKGGGAIKGIGETFQPNLFSGTGNFLYRFLHRQVATDSARSSRFNTALETVTRPTVWDRWGRSSDFQGDVGYNPPTFRLLLNPSNIGTP